MSDADADVDLRTERANRGLSLTAAAEAMELSSKSILRDAENGLRIPHPKNQLRIAAFYGFKVTDIWPVAEPTEAAA